MAAYQTITTTRTTQPNNLKLLTDLRAAIDATVGYAFGTLPGDVTVKKATAWTAPQIASAQSIIDNAPADTPQLEAQQVIDTMPIVEKAIVLAIIDEINILRGLHSLAPRTVPQAIAAVRTKAGTL